MGKLNILPYATGHFMGILSLGCVP